MRRVKRRNQSKTPNKIEKATITIFLMHPDINLNRPIQVYFQL